MEISSPGSYYGSKKSEQKVPGIILSEYDYIETSTPWHYHENPYFMYVLQGDMVDINKKEKVLCPSGSLIFHNWQEVHYNHKAKRLARGFHVEFERNWYYTNNPATTLWEGSQLISDPRVHHLLAKIYMEFLCCDAYSEISIELLLLRLCELLVRDQMPEYSQPPEWINALKEIINSGESPVNLAALSEELGVHPAYISRAVPRYLSTTLGDYVRQQKLKIALRDLMDSEYSLTEIAYRCGFADQSHFIRVFRKYFNRTPGDFRAMVEGG